MWSSSPKQDPKVTADLELVMPLSALVHPPEDGEIGVCGAGMVSEETVPGGVGQTWRREAPGGHQGPPLLTRESVGPPPPRPSTPRLLGCQPAAPRHLRLCLWGLAGASLWRSLEETPWLSSGPSPALSPQAWRT